MSALYTNETWFQAAFITLVLGGGCAWLAGSAIASTWRGLWVAVIAAIPMAMAVRFVHFALFNETLLSLKPWAAETLILLAVMSLAFQRTRARQMVRQYYWLYEPKGYLGWRLRQDAPEEFSHG
jgi:hypothetical protein